MDNGESVSVHETPRLSFSSSIKREIRLEEQHFLPRLKTYTNQNGPK